MKVSRKATATKKPKRFTEAELNNMKLHQLLGVAIEETTESALQRFEAWLENRYATLTKGMNSASNHQEFQNEDREERHHLWKFTQAFKESGIAAEHKALCERVKALEHGCAEARGHVEWERDRANSWTPEAIERLYVLLDSLLEPKVCEDDPNEHPTYDAALMSLPGEES